MLLSEALSGCTFGKNIVFELKTVVILQSNYIPWKGYFDLIHDADEFIFYDEVKYTKNDWRNRNLIHTKNGLQWLSIPIHKEAVKLKISEVEIQNKDWQELHFKTLWLTYKKAPYFNQLEPVLEHFYHEREWQNLSELNQYTIRYLSNWLGLDCKLTNSSDYPLEGDRVLRLVNLLAHVKADKYISGPSAKDYLGPEELELFTSHGIEVTFKDYSGYTSYTQLNEPFTHGVSILDMIANVSKDQIPELIWGWRN